MIASERYSMSYRAFFHLVFRFVAQCLGRFIRGTSRRFSRTFGFLYSADIVCQRKN